MVHIQRFYANVEVFRLLKKTAPLGSCTTTGSMESEIDDNDEFRDAAVLCTNLSQGPRLTGALHRRDDDRRHGVSPFGSDGLSIGLPGRSFPASRPARRGRFGEITMPPKLPSAATENSYGAEGWHPHTSRSQVAPRLTDNRSIACPASAILTCARVTGLRAPRRQALYRRSNPPGPCSLARGPAALHGESVEPRRIEWDHLWQP